MENSVLSLGNFGHSHALEPRHDHPSGISQLFSQQSAAPTTVEKQLFEKESWKDITVEQLAKHFHCPITQVFLLHTKSSERKLTRAFFRLLTILECARRFSKRYVEEMEFHDGLTENLCL
jgi:hypothetical protein